MVRLANPVRSGDQSEGVLPLAQTHLPKVAEIGALPQSDRASELLQWRAEHGDSLRATIRRLLYNKSLVDDVEQELWLKVHQIAHEYDPLKGRVSAWLRRIARNITVDTNRSEARRHRLHTSPRSQQERAAHVSPPADPHAVSSRGDDRAALTSVITDALNSLTPPHRAAVELHHFRNVPSKGLPAALGVPSGTSKSQLHRGRAAIREHLTRDDE